MLYSSFRAYQLSNREVRQDCTAPCNLKTHRHKHSATISLPYLLFLLPLLSLIYRLVAAQLSPVTRKPHFSFLYIPTQQTVHHSVTHTHTHTSAHTLPDSILLQVCLVRRFFLIFSISAALLSFVKPLIGAECAV